jgi:hypothetical protein
MRLKAAYLSTLAFSTRGEKIIKNVNIPACRNCIYYTPSASYSDFTDSLNRCEKFGVKNIVTNEIRYDFAESCRTDESKCGLQGKFFEEEPNISLKMAKHYIREKIPYLCIFIFPIMTLILSVRNGPN